MINIIYSELLKLRKSYLAALILLGGIFIPGMMLAAGIIDNGYEAINKDSCLNLIANTNIFQLQFLNIIMFSIVAGYVFSREYTNKTLNSLYSYPISKFKIVLGKFITILMLIMIVYTINFFSIFAVIVILSHGLSVIDIMYVQLKMTVISLGLQVILIPLPALIGCISKNIIFPTVYGVIGAIASMFMSIGGIYMQFCPFSIPALPFYYFYKGDPIDYIAVLLCALGIFIISVSAFIFYLKKYDIN
ncbi:ABC transporter permease [uncultured Clostridium sp.]|uniref:ABC transporter permease n=1 Tax=uncultured Clostridium sp. TaxID=59620 RepID=UPI0025ECADE6|nr:ABC transporter permease [uncultured Clostridium sp.]